MSLPNVVAAIFLITGLTLACGGAEETPAVTEQPKPASAQPTVPAAQSSQATGETATEAAEEETKGPQPPPKDELIKFANWDDNPVKLLNWIAAYIVAHGLDHPIRVIDVEEVVAAIFLITGLTLACGGAEETPAAAEQTKPAAAQPTASAAQSSQAAEETASAAATEAAEEEAKGPQPPPKDELIKFANWDDNPVKLLNWIAAYIVAHGLDRPIRVFDVEEGAYQEPLLANDVDIVIAADGAWAEEQSSAGKVIRLGSASPVDATLAVVLHPSMEQRAPDVVRFLETLTIEAELLSKQSAMIRGGRVGLKENAVGLNFLKREYAVWMNWTGEDVGALVNQAIEEGKIGHCRQFINYAPTQMGNEGSRYCKDDPTKTSGNR